MLESPRKSVIIGCCCCFLVEGRGKLNLQLLKLLWQPQRSYLHLNDSALSARHSLAIGLATSCSATFRQFFIFLHFLNSLCTDVPPSVKNREKRRFFLREGGDVCTQAILKLFFIFFATFITFRKKSQLISSQHFAPILV